MSENFDVILMFRIFGQFEHSVFKSYVSRNRNFLS